jgi:hypothetical protein
MLPFETVYTEGASIFEVVLAVVVASTSKSVIVIQSKKNIYVPITDMCRAVENEQHPSSVNDTWQKIMSGKF